MGGGKAHLFGIFDIFFFKTGKYKLEEFRTIASMSGLLALPVWSERRDSSFWNQPASINKGVVSTGDN